MNSENATFAATYTILEEHNSVFPIRGEFDPQGVSIGWVVSYWNEYVNYHSLGAWAGYVDLIKADRPSIVTTRLITHNGNPADTTVGFDTFMIQD